MSAGPSEDPQLEEAQPPEASCARIVSVLTGSCRLSSEMIWATFCSFRRRGTGASQQMACQIGVSTNTACYLRSSPAGAWEVEQQCRNADAARRRWHDNPALSPMPVGPLPDRGQA